MVTNVQQLLNLFSILSVLFTFLSLYDVPGETWWFKLTKFKWLVIMWLTTLERHLDNIRTEDKKNCRLISLTKYSRKEDVNKDMGGLGVGVRWVSFDVLKNSSQSKTYGLNSVRLDQILHITRTNPKPTTNGRGWIRCWIHY